jgi:hypothetical protein
MRLHKILLNLSALILLCIGVTALGGNICTSDSPCSCDAFCDGYYEFQGHEEAYCLSNPVDCYNTIDSCQDGQFSSLNYVINITVHSLNDSVFRAKDTIQADVTVYSSSANIESIYILYTNDSKSSGVAWKKIFNDSFGAAETRHFYANLTLDNAVGNHTVRAIDIYDQHTNITCGWDGVWREYADTDDITFEVLKENDPPQVQNLYPPDFSTQTSQRIDFGFSVSDDFSLVNCTLYGNFSGTWLENQSVYGISNTSVTNISIDVADGTYVWNVYCYDDRNSEGYFSTNYTIMVDTQAPLVQVESPANGSTIFSNLINFVFNVTDFSSLESCSLIIDGVAYMSNNSVIYSGFASQGMGFMLDNGNYAWRINCTDSLSHQGSSESYNLTINNSPPILLSVYINQTDYTPLESSIVYALIQFNVTDSEDIGDLNDSTCSCSVDNESTFVADFILNDSCGVSVIGNIKEYSCQIPMNFWYPAGNWSVRVAIADKSLNNLTDTSTNFIYNELAAFSYQNTDISFASINSSRYNQYVSADYTTLIINNGNTVLHINITASNLVSSQDVTFTQDFYANSINDYISAIQLSTDSTWIADLPAEGENYQGIYWFFRVPDYLWPGSYIANWTLSVN